MTDDTKARQILAEEMGVLDENLPAYEFSIALREAAISAMLRFASLQSSALGGDGPFCQKCNGPFMSVPEAHCDHNCTPYWNPNPAKTAAMQAALTPSMTVTDEMLDRAQCVYESDSEYGISDADMRAAITAALNPQQGKNNG